MRFTAREDEQNILEKLKKKGASLLHFREIALICYSGVVGIWVLAP